MNILGNIWKIIQWYSLYLGSLFYLYFRRRVLSYPPGPYPLPTTKCTVKLTRRPLDHLENLQKVCGEVISLQVGNKIVVVVSSYDLIKEVLNRPKFLGCFEGCNYQGRPTGIIGTEGQDYKHHRKFLAHCLDKLDVGESETRISILQDVRKLIDKLSYKQYGPINSTNLFNPYVTNSLWTLISGHNNDPELPLLVDLVSRFVRKAGLVSSNFFFPWTAARNDFKCVNESKIDFDSIIHFITRKVEEYHPIKDNPYSIMGCYFDRILQEKDYTDSIFREELGKANLIACIADLLISGPDAVSSALTWAVLYLILHPGYQSQMYNEMRLHLKCDDPTVEDRDKLPFTQAVICEVLRLSSVVPMASCRRMTSRTTLDEYELPKGTLVIPNFHAANRDRYYWGSDVLDFNPSRFLPSFSLVGRCRNTNFLPFSSGRRDCIGKVFAEDQLFLFLSTLISTFELVPSSDMSRGELRSCLDCDQNVLVQTPKPFTFEIKPRAVFASGSGLQLQLPPSCLKRPFQLEPLEEQEAYFDPEFDPEDKIKPELKKRVSFQLEPVNEDEC